MDHFSSKSLQLSSASTICIFHKMECISTKVLMLSDTHGDWLNSMPDTEVDVAIHCGDLTEESKLAEFRKMVDLLQALKAHLKLVIAGNHDFTLDIPVFKDKLSNIEGQVEDTTIKREYGSFGEARALFEAKEAKAAGIIFLEEGAHEFKLTNGALLQVYASPFTPSVNGWAFQYDPAHGHEWQIPEVDIVITHGPPKGILDYVDRSHVGDRDLFAAVARTRPQIHCFGHIHSRWGARKVTWRPRLSETPSHLTDIDNEQSETITSLATLEKKEFDSVEAVQAKELRVRQLKAQGHCAAGRMPGRGMQTLFVNAAIEGKNDDSQHWVWIAEIELPRCV